ncbi:TonB-dependent receptor [Alteromonas sp. 5E99-2]|uniref:TonB-dependent receptor family protein n=1 Tax=Alteromonas sp. 5E99-2 TaxID=2817683 RepID=UPI001A99D221|nr:TonB-dependent receptor [Alteromonas sp. 5E99-2]MBO1256876.1 TonB-dependent receptor [Alteromonas sp. 5E99-2]
MTYRTLFIPTLLACYSIAVIAEEPLETIEVYGVRSSIEADRQEIHLTPGGVTLIDIDKLQEASITNLADVLRYVPGVTSSSDAGSDGIFFSSRGSNLDASDFDMNGIKLLQDGLPVTTADGNNHNRIIDPLASRYAVFARGANGIKYGASTLGGAVNFVSPTAHDTSGTEVFINGGSHGLLQERVTFSKVFNENYDGLVTIERKDWDGFREQNEQQRTGIYANFGVRLHKDVSTRFFVTYVENDQELPGSLTRAQVQEDPDQAGSTAVSGNFQLDVETLRLANVTRWNINDTSNLQVGLSIEQQRLFHPIVDQIFVDFDGPGPADPVEVFSLLIDTNHQDVAANIRYQQQWGKHDLLFGANYGRNRVDGEHFRNLNGRPNGLTTLIDNRAESLELFALDRWQFADKWTLVGGTQVVTATRDISSIDVSDDSVRAPSGTFDSINPRLGLIYAVNNNASVFANISRVYEPPTNFELEDEVSQSQQSLDAMDGTVFEVGTRGQQTLNSNLTWNWDITAYYTKLNDEILSVEDPNAPNTSLATNVDSTIHAGLETLFGASFKLGNSNNRIDPLLSFTYNRFEFDNDPIYGDNVLPAAPEYQIKAELIYRAENGFYAGPTLDWIDKRFADFANTFVVDDYTLVGLRAGWSNKDWRVFAEIRNLFDQEFIANHGVRERASEDDAILNPGQPRSFYVGLQASF